MTARGPRCHCGTPIAHTPGKRPRIYCSDRCRKAAKRALAALEGRPSGPAPTATSTAAEPNPDTPLGTTTRTTVPLVRGHEKERVHVKTAPKGREARDDAHRLREGLQEVSRVERLCRCGRRLVAGAAALTVGSGASGASAGYAGVAVCGSVHICPVCAASIRRVRAAELEAAGVAWESDSRGMAMVTFTMRHFRRQTLAELVETQRAAWRRSLGQNARRSTKAALRSLGLRGYVRAWETTHGGNGWHAHYHVVMFFDRPLTREQAAELETLAYEVWADAVETEGGYRPSREHGVRVDVPDRGESGRVARYLMKGQDRARWSVAAEATRADIKVGSNGHRAPFEIARGAVAGDREDVRLWLEYEAAAHGLRALYWSQGLKALLAELVELDDRRDDQVAADEAAPGEPVALIPPSTWYRHVIRHRGRSLQLIHAAERWGADGVRSVVEGWGLIWGVDVLEPDQLPEGALPTAAEVLARLERAELAARAEVWRRELERQDREERLGRVVYQPGAWAARKAEMDYRRRIEERELVGRERAAVDFRERLRAAKASRAAGGVS